MSPNLKTALLTPFLLCTMFSQAQSIPMRNVEVSLGDEPWKTDAQLLIQGKNYSGLYRIRGTITVVSPPQEPMLILSALGSFEVWFDGEMVGRNGRPGTDLAGEEPGVFLKVLSLDPDQVQPGEHRLELRISNWRAGGKIRYYGVALGEQAQLTQLGLSETVFFMSFVGFFTAGAVLFFLFFVLVEKRETYLIFALLCVCVSVLLTMEYMKFFYTYSYSFHFTRLRIIAGITALSGLLLTRFCAVRFGNENSWILPLTGLVMIIILLFQPGYDAKSFFSMICALVVALHITLQAVRKQKKGAWLVMTGIGFCIVPSIFGSHYMDGYFFFGFVGLILVLLIELAMHARDQRRILQESLQRSSTLKQELMKKHIQPHFILNTLTSVVEWIEENPSTGIKMIEALAEEFRIFNKIVDRALIPMKEELALCHAHLEVMSFTYNKTLEISQIDLNPEELIPPGIFHTLLENALTHGHLSANEPVMSITRYQQEKQTRFKISNPIPLVTRQPAEEGGGTAYIKARLEEGFPGKWHMEMGSEKHSWQTVITFKNK